MSKAFKFCPRCGHETSVKEKLMSCGSCGLDTYFSPKPVQEIILRNSEGKYLFCVRGVEPRKGYLDFPGGFVEPNETFEQSVRRELMEELGIEAGNIEYLRSSYGDYMFQGVNYHVVGNSYLAELPDESQVKPADDVHAVEYYSLQEIPRDRLAWPSANEVLKILAEREIKRR